MDRLRIVSIGVDGRARLEQELQARDFVYTQRDTFNVAPGSRRLRAASAPGRRYQGSLPLGEERENTTVGATLLVKGADAPEAAKRLERLLDKLDDTRRELYIEWRPDGLARSVYSPLRGTATWGAQYRPVEWPQTRRMAIPVTWPTAPLPQGLPLDVLERFTPPADKTLEPANNEVVNPSFEIDTSGWTGAGSQAPVITRSTTRATRGLASGRVTGTAATASGQTAGIIETQIDGRCKVGDKIAIRASIWNAGTANDVFIRVRWIDDAGNITFANAPAGATTPTKGAWTPISQLLTAPVTGTYRVEISAISNAAAQTFDVYADEIAGMTLPSTASAVPAYGDGDGLLHRWEGERHKSRSIELEESKLAEYTRGGAPADEAIDLGMLLYRDAPASNASLLVHTAREPTPDHEALVRGSYLVAGAAGVTDHFLTPGVRWDATKSTGFYATVQGANTLRIYRRNRDGTNTQVATTAIAPAVVAGQRVWVLCRAEGNVITAEFYTQPPMAGRSNYAARTTYLIPQAEIAEWGENRAGSPAARAWAMAPTAVAGAPATSLLERFEARHYYWPQQKLPDSVLLRRVPGTAPALLDVGVAPSFNVGFAPIHGCFHGWRRRPGVENLAANGDIYFGIRHWRNFGNLLLGGGSGVAPGTGSGVDDVAAYVDLATGAVANSGAFYRINHRFKRGRLYTVEFYAARTAGAAGWQVAVDFDNTAHTALAPTAIDPATFVAHRFTVQATADRNLLDVLFRHTGNVAGNTLRVGGVTVYEGLPPGPVAAGRTLGHGAHAPFGHINAEQLIASDLSYFGTETTETTAYGGQHLWINNSAQPGIWEGFEFLVDPTLVEAPEFAGDEYDVDVYVMGDWPGDRVMNARAWSVPEATAIYYSATSEFPNRAFARPFGAAGRAMPAVTGRLLRRLGSVTLSRSGGRHRIGIGFMHNGPATCSYYLDFLVLLPSHARMTSPTGKDVVDYPVYTNTPDLTNTGSGREMKWTTSEGDGQVETIRQVATPNASYPVGTPQPGAEYVLAPAVGLGGEPMELPPGDCEIFTLLIQGIPPDPPGVPVTMVSSYLSDGAVRARVTPRYRLMAPA